MNITTEQLSAAELGGVVRIEVNGKTFVLLNEARFEEMEEMSYGDITGEEMDLLADEANDIISQGEAAGD